MYFLVRRPIGCFHPPQCYQRPSWPKPWALTEVEPHHLRHTCGPHGMLGHGLLHFKETKSSEGNHRLYLSMLASTRFVEDVKIEILNDRFQLTLIVFASGVREQFLFSSVRQFLNCFVPFFSNLVSGLNLYRQSDLMVHLPQIANILSNSIAN